MTFVRVDKHEEEVIEGFEYANKDGNIERIEMLRPKTYFKYVVSSGSCVHVYYDDIPKLIKALQAAYNLHNKEVA